MPTIMIKERASSKNWYYFNDKRLGYNPNNRPQKPSQTEAEITNVNDKHLDIYSNGFKLRDSDNEVNASGNIYNFVAWGQSIVGTNNIPATTR